VPLCVYGRALTCETASEVCFEAQSQRKPDYCQSAQRCVRVKAVVPSQEIQAEIVNVQPLDPVGPNPMATPAGRPPPPPPPAPRFVDTEGVGFDVFDSDKDGFLTKSEFSAATRANPSAALPSTPHAARLLPTDALSLPAATQALPGGVHAKSAFVFGKLDTDGDGKLSRHEYNKGFLAETARIPIAPGCLVKVRVSVERCVQVCPSLSIHVCMYVCIRVYMYIHIHTHKHTHTQGANLEAEPTVGLPPGATLSRVAELTGIDLGGGLYRDTYEISWRPTREFRHA